MLKASLCHSLMMELMECVFIVWHNDLQWFWPRLSIQPQLLHHRGPTCWKIYSNTHADIEAMPFQEPESASLQLRNIMYHDHVQCDARQLCATLKVLKFARRELKDDICDTAQLLNMLSCLRNVPLGLRSLGGSGKRLQNWPSKERNIEPNEELFPIFTTCSNVFCWTPESDFGR